MPGTLSLHCYSEDSLRDRSTGVLSVCSDMIRDGTHGGWCPATQPVTP